MACVIGSFSDGTVITGRYLRAGDYKWRTNLLVGDWVYFQSHLSSSDSGFCKIAEITDSKLKVVSAENHKEMWVAKP